MKLFKNFNLSRDKKDIEEFQSGDTEYFNKEFAKNNPSSELYRVKVDFDRCEIYEKCRL